MEEIKFDKRNYRKHNQRNKELIKKSLEECGAGRSIVIDNEGEIIAGNGIYEQAKVLNIPVKIIESDGSELVVVKRIDLMTDDERRKQLAVMDNSTSDSSEFNLELLSQDFKIEKLDDMGINIAFPEIDEDDFMDNESLQEFNTNKQLALSRMPITKYLCIVFDDNFTKQEFIEQIKKENPDSNISERTQYCTYDFKEKDMLND